MTRFSFFAATLCLLLVATAQLNAQTCSNSLLFKKGAELAYRSYLPKGAVFSSKLKFNETTEFTFIVTDVVDSAGATYSHITKKAEAAQHKKNNYEKKYTLTCKDGKVYFPADFYSSDTVYLGDIYPAMKNRGIHTANNLMEPAMQYFSTDPGNSDFGYVHKTIKTNAVLRDFGWGEYNSKGGISNSPSDGMMHYETNASIAKHEFVVTSLIKAVNKQGTEKIEVADQAYHAIKIEVDVAITIESHNRSQKKSPVRDMTGSTALEKLTLFYNEEIGIIKTTGDKKHGYFELYKITMPK